MAQFNMRSKPKGLFKWFLHAPSFIYRARLGFVFGRRLLMIEHRGRKSGTRYTTVLEVAGRDPDGNEYMVTSGTGPRADWYLNILANGVEAVWIGSRRHHGTVRPLEPMESAEVFHRYELAHPRTAERLEETMGVSYDGTDDGRVDMMRKIPMVGIAITD